LRIVGLLCIGAIAMSGCSSQPDNPDDICAVFEERRSWYKDAVKAQSRWHTQVPTLMAFAHQESTFGRKAKPPRKKWLGVIPGPRPSTAYGYAQATDAAWADYQQATDRWSADRDDFGDAMDFIGWYNDVSRRRLGLELGDAVGLYLAYHEGHGGYARGTWSKKPKLRAIAAKVGKRARTYAAQLSKCEAGLKKKRWWFF